MRSMDKERLFEPRQRSPKSRKHGRKKFAVEYRWKVKDDETTAWRRIFCRRGVWSVWGRYRTEKQCDQALHALKTRPDHFDMYEYRKEPTVKFRPLQDKVVIEYVAAKDRTEGGILLPDICKTPPTEAIVLQMGPGKRADSGELIPMPCEVGDKVLVSVSGMELRNPDPDSNKTIRLVDADDILGVANA